MYTIHGRTRSENYSTPCDHAGIRQGMDATPAGFDHVLRIANGDIFTLKDALALQKSTHCHGVMISRGALGNPWVFEELTGVRTQAPEFREWYDVVLRHVSYQEEHFGPIPLATILMRKHLLWYVKGFPQSKVFRERFNRVVDFAEVRSILKEFAAVVPADIRRFEQGEPMSLGSNYDPKYEMDRQLDRGVGDEELG
jgi:tRNA-dihydrouridine synthase B